MGQRDTEYILSGVMELDEGFFTTETLEEEKGKPLNRGRDSQKKSKVLVMAESLSIEAKRTKKGKPHKVGHIKMIVIPDLKSEIITQVVEKNVCNESVIDSDDSTSYVKFKEIVREHRPQVIPETEDGNVELA